MSETVLLLGSGSREHAMAWKLIQSQRVQRIYVAPGNGGIKQMDPRVITLDLDIKIPKQVTDWCQQNKPSLVIVGPEDPLDRGIADELNRLGVACFGPERAAAQIECNKSFAKDFMAKHQIPTARYRNFADGEADKAKEFVRTAPFRALVIKASGLAAGKGVIVAASVAEACDAIDSILVNKAFGSAGNTVVVEELLDGPEVSVFAFTDGIDVKPLLPSQDHKRAYDGDTGPNTGGMGAYCPYPFVDQKTMAVIEKDILRKTVDGLRTGGKPFVGLLYAGLMITSDGPKVIEFNCRFGDPETQSVLPLLESDLYDICYACSQQQLQSIELKWRPKTACGIVIASNGYPETPVKGQLIDGIDSAQKAGLLVFHGGTQYRDNKFYNSGGRILTVVAVADDLDSAVNRALMGAELIKIDNSFHRKDIAKKTLDKLPRGLSYKASGVDIVAGEELVDNIKKFTDNTKRTGVMESIGGFGALFDLKSAGYVDPILVSGTDGVGTKLKVAIEYKKWDTVGIDLVAMCVNDILVQGAEPLFFLDYFACSRLEVNVAAKVVEGIAKGCKESNCGLIGGETAEMPGMYADGEFDLAGFAVGAVERQSLLPRLVDIQATDVVIGVPSSGVHSNGFSLVRKLLSLRGVNYTDRTPFDPNRTFGDVLLEPTKLYVRSLLGAIKSGKIKALSHITGGGIIENIPRTLPKHLGVVLDASKWTVQEIYKWMKREGNISDREMLTTFNCGLGMILIVSKSDAQSVVDTIESTGERAHIVGHVVPRGSDPVVVNNFPALPPLTATTTTTVGRVVARKRVAVLLSGSGTNFQAIVDYVGQNSSTTAIDIALVIGHSTKSQEGLDRAVRAGIPTKRLLVKSGETREEFDQRIQTLLEEYTIELVCLAGYMRIMSDQFVQQWTGRMVNIHPALLPSFKGTEAYRQALDAGVKWTGCTVHFVTPEMDAGPIIAQSVVNVESDDTVHKLTERGKQVEHKTYAPALELVAQGKVVMDSNGKIQWNL
ncbi:trifunctional purine biosynthetic protein adenosine-3-like [Oppia nitens]|uniref:trifunctional purine biosynthetic protein adenosine-3-like n=1 Tax=Oppia nitens TaxID=1686743 RepID=UPI0023DAE61B|nr:trifunctional purine biosynthetic protein adenosine-3-like [Oppia nitens]